MRRFRKAVSAASVVAAAGLSLLPGARALAQTPFLYTDWTLDPGRVMYAGPTGAEQTLLTRAEGSVYNVTLGPDGDVYYSDDNDRDVYRWIGGTATRIYRHSTYLRDIDFNSRGELHFSEASGAGGDGVIYRLRDGVAQVAYRVRLSQIGGFWAGNFALGPNDALYLSTGNTSNAAIYRVASGTPQLVYRDVGSIAGFDVDFRGTIYFADWFHRIMRVYSASGATAVRTDRSRRFADVVIPEQSIALGPEAGRVNNLAVHPTNARVLYATNATGGVYRSADGGQNWTPRRRGIDDRQTDGILVYPKDAKIVIAVGNGGIYRSTDEGVNWTRVLSTPRTIPPRRIEGFLRWWAISPVFYDAAADVIYASPFCHGLYRSSNAGRTWSRVYGGTGFTAQRQCVTAIARTPESGGTIYLATPGGFMAGVGGRGWRPVASSTLSPVSGHRVVPFSLVTAAAQPNTIFATTRGVGGIANTRVWVRPAGSTSWVSAMPKGTPPWVSWSDLRLLAARPGSASVVILGGITSLYEQLNTVRSPVWSRVNCRSSDICGVDYHAVVPPTSTTLFAPHDQGIFELSGGFRATEAGLANTQLYDLEVGTGGAIYIGMQDTGSRRRASVGASWNPISVGGSGDVLDFVVDPRDDRHIFVRINTTQIYRSTDGGATTTASTGIGDGAGFWNHQMAYDAPRKTVYVGSERRGVYKSTDDGATFTAANTGISKVGVRCLYLPGGTGNTLYMGSTKDGIYRSTNAGGSWTKLTGFPSQPVLALTGDAAGRLYAGTPIGPLQSTNNGTAWSRLLNGLPGTFAVASEILVDPACDCRLYLGLGYYDSLNQYGGGVYQSLDRGRSWQPFPLTSDPEDRRLTITSLKIDPKDPRRLLVGTYGNGARVILREPPRTCSC